MRIIVVYDKYLQIGFCFILNQRKKQKIESRDRYTNREREKNKANCNQTILLACSLSALSTADVGLAVRGV
jgi:hypothetical protein